MMEELTYRDLNRYIYIYSINPPKTSSPATLLRAMVCQPLALFMPFRIRTFPKCLRTCNVRFTYQRARFLSRLPFDLPARTDAYIYHGTHS